MIYLTSAPLYRPQRQGLENISTASNTSEEEKEHDAMCDFVVDDDAEVVDECPASPCAAEAPQAARTRNARVFQEAGASKCTTQPLDPQEAMDDAMLDHQVQHRRKPG